MAEIRGSTSIPKLMALKCEIDDFDGTSSTVGNCLSEYPVLIFSRLHDLKKHSNCHVPDLVSLM